MIPIGTTIHAISLMPEGPAKLVRSAGAYGQLVAFVNRSKAKPTAASADDDANPSPEALMLEERAEAEAAGSSSAPKTHAQVKLQSGEVRLVLAGCCATIGRVSNADHEHERLGKAGRSRWLGRRPKVRGVAMNAVDHPHGGGRGKSKSNMVRMSPLVSVKNPFLTCVNPRTAPAVDLRSKDKGTQDKKAWYKEWQPDGRSRTSPPQREASGQALNTSLITLRRVRCCRS